MGGPSFLLLQPRITTGTKYIGTHYHCKLVGFSCSSTVDPKAQGIKPRIKSIADPTQEVNESNVE